MKPNEKLLAALGSVRSEWVEEAAPDELLPEDAPPQPLLYKRPKPSAAKAAWLRWGALAACAVLVCLAGWRLTVRPRYSMDTASSQSAATAADASAADEAVQEPQAEEAIQEPQAAITAEDAPVQDVLTHGNGPEDAKCAQADGAALAAKVGTATDLPLLSLGENAAGGMGYEGYLAYSIDELANGNPWLAATEAERAALTALPVYRTKSWNRYGIPLSLSKAEMRALAGEAAAGLGVSVTGVESTTVFPGNRGTDLPPLAVYQIEAATSGGYTIEVDGHGLITVWPGESYSDGGLALPAQYSFTYADTSDEQAAQTLDYLLETFAGFTGLQEPAHAVFTDRNIYGERSTSYGAYEGSGTLAERIVNFSLRSVSFAPNDEGELMLMRKADATAGAELLGEYPLLTADEAQALLENGSYATSVPHELTGAEPIARVELVYRTGEMLMPYYRFLIELPEEFRPADAPNLLDYGAYYVPAVRPEYLTELPTWDGSFN